MQYTKIRNTKDGVKLKVDSHYMECEPHHKYVVDEFKNSFCDNYNEILKYFSQLAVDFDNSEKLWEKLYDMDEINTKAYKEAEDAHEESVEKYLKTIYRIGSLVIDPKSFYFDYMRSCETSDKSLVFALFYDGIGLANSFEGKGADYTVVIDSHDLEICIETEPDGFYFNFSELDS